MWCIKRFKCIRHLLTHLLTPRCRVLLEKPTGLQLVKKFPAFHGTRRFITALTSVRHLSLSWASPISILGQPNVSGIQTYNMSYIKLQNHYKGLWLWTTSFFTSFLLHKHTRPHHTPNGIRTHSPIKRPAADQRLRMAKCTVPGKWAVSIVMVVFMSAGYVW